MKTKVVYVRQFVIEISGAKVDVEKINKAFTEFIAACGWSVVRGPEIQEDYDIDQNLQRKYIEGLYIEYPNIDAKVENYTNFIEIPDA